VNSLHRSQVWLAGLTLLFCSNLTAAAGNTGSENPSPEVTVDLSRGAIAEFLPNEAFGAAVDGQKHGQITGIYNPQNVEQMLHAGINQVSYSLRTELGVEAWHWSEQGSWSEPEQKQGYWVSSDRADQDVRISHGYRLPRRGNTRDQANDDGYSRLTDGDEVSFWKSNPYLDQRYTGENDDVYPQWVVIDLGSPQPVNAIKILWGTPYATRYEVQFWIGNRDRANWSRSPDSKWHTLINAGEWHTFVNGSVSDGDGAPRLVRLIGTSVQVRYLRILLRESSGTGPPDSTDIRDSLGFAIREIYAGFVDENGVFEDQVRHAPKNDTQTVTYASSTDSWHRAIDLDPNTEQPGFDLLFQSGLTRDLPVLLPVALLYDTPENAAAEIRFLRRRGYKTPKIVMGEEPDGQFVSPEHEAALYLQFATTIRDVDPNVELGGLSFEDGIVNLGFDVKPNTSWLTTFLSYIEDHARIDDFKFLSFEFYPFGDLCQTADLAELPAMLKQQVERLREDSLGRALPMMITEFGLSFLPGRPLVEFPSALVYADIVGEFLKLGGKATYLYEYEPLRPVARPGDTYLYEDEPPKPVARPEECAGYGYWMLFDADEYGKAKWPMPTYFATQLISREWAQPLNQPHKVLAASTNVLDDEARSVVTAYALERPDGKVSVMLINKDPQQTYSVHISLIGGEPVGNFTEPVEVFQYSARQYKWLEGGVNGQPIQDDPPRRFSVPSLETVSLPPYSLTILRGDPLGFQAHLPRLNSSTP